METNPAEEELVAAAAAAETGFLAAVQRRKAPWQFPFWRWGEVNLDIFSLSPPFKNMTLFVWQKEHLRPPPHPDAPVLLSL